MSKDKNHRIAVFGGTFDPPHKGHICLAEKVLNEGYADEILFIPALNPPHKPVSPCADFEDRLNLLRIALEKIVLPQKNKSFSISRIEGERTGKASYTYDTMVELSRIYKNKKLILLIGADSLLHLHTWYKAADIINNWTLLTYPRDHVSKGNKEVLEKLRKKWPENIASLLFESILPFGEFNISSTEIRKRLTDQKIITDFIDPLVKKYIKEKGLYQRD